VTVAGSQVDLCLDIFAFKQILYNKMSKSTISNFFEMSAASLPALGIAKS
jgi:hypothetical protein